MPNPDALHGPDTGAEAPLEQARKTTVNERMLGVVAGMEGPAGQKLQAEMTRNVLRDSIAEARQRVEKSGCVRLVEEAEQTVNQLPRDVQSTWRAYLRSLKTLLTHRDARGGVGDPIGVTGHLSNTRVELQTLGNHLQIETDPAKRQAIQNVLTAYRTVSQTVGIVHPALPVPGTEGRWNNPAVQERGSYLLHVGLFGAFAGAATLMGGLALMADDEHRDMTMTGIMLGAAALTAMDQYKRQISFLADPSSRWHALNVRGNDWANFVEQYYQSGMNNRQVRDFVANSRPDRTTPEQIKERRAAILSLAPSPIRAQLETMLTTRRDGAEGADFRDLDGLLRQATTRDARDIVVRFIRSGANYQSMRALNNPQITQRRA